MTEAGFWGCAAKTGEACLVVGKPLKTSKKIKQQGRSDFLVNFPPRTIILAY